MTAITLDLPLQTIDVREMKDYLMKVALQRINKMNAQKTEGLPQEQPTLQDIQAINESTHGEEGVEALSFLSSLKS